jgi:hypothetical protein
MILMIPIVIQTQRAGYESLLLILLVLFWGIYRFYKSAKNTTSPDAPQDDATNVPDYDIPEAKAVFREPSQETEITAYKTRSSDPISASVQDVSSDNSVDQHDTSASLADFDPKKAMIWSEVLKRPYC